MLWWLLPSEGMIECALSEFFLWAICIQFALRDSKIFIHFLIAIPRGSGFCVKLSEAYSGF